MPLLVISPWARSNSVDHTLSDQSSIIKFVEDNWSLPSISGSFDRVAGSLDGMFDFAKNYGHAPNKRIFLLDPKTGQPTQR
jgi:phospholipase C